MPRPIPIRNVYYLFLYAWDRFREGRAIEMGATGGPEVLDLFAKVLIKGVRAYSGAGSTVDTPKRRGDARPAGRFLIAETLKRASSCAGGRSRLRRVDADVPHNRILKSTLRTLARRRGSTPASPTNCCCSTGGSSACRTCPSRPACSGVCSCHGTAATRPAARVCPLAFGGLLPGEGGRRARFADVLEDEVRMSAVFEAFVRNFYDRTRQFDVAAERIDWDAVYGDPARRLPAVMRTDVVLAHALQSGPS